MSIFPEEQELQRLEDEQSRLEDQVTQAELSLETEKTETEQFRHRYYQAVGRLFAELDELDALLAYEDMLRNPGNANAQMQAQTMQARAEKSAEEAGLVNARPEPPADITAELKQAYRKATKLIHPDRATNETERLRRTSLMAQVNRAYERGDIKAIEKLITEFGQDPESIAGEDTASRLVKAIRRIAQLRRRLVEMKQELQLHRKTSIFQLKKTIETAEAMGSNPIADLVKQLTQSITERKIRLEIARQKSR